MSSSNNRGRVTGLVFNPWNLLLIVPFVVLLTPIYNSTSPGLFGMPFFYWFQFLIIGVGVLSTITVYRMTRGVPVDAAPGEEPDVDALDERRLAEEKPAETDLAEPEPAEPEPAEPEPAGEKPAEAESADEKPAEGKDV
jgi:hypothetical protein